LKELLNKFFENRCTSAETQELITHIKEGNSSDMPDLEESFFSLPDYHPISDTDADRIFKSIVKKKEWINGAKSKKNLFLKITAIFILLLASSIFTLLFQNSEITEISSFGEIRNITFPDGSSVTLNGNSSITYQEKWDDEQPRIVKMEGEGFFSVTHTKNHQPFLVQTSNGFSVEVLGTKFNFIHRRGKAEVVLAEGKVRVNIRKNGLLEQIAMKPGDEVLYEEKSHSVVRHQVTPEIKSSWRNARISLDDSSLAEVIVRIEETFGVKVELINPELSQLKLWGTVPSENLASMLKGIEASFDLTIQQNGKIITISKSTLN